ncbi:glycosyltransferase [uncultured Thiodictyon sp.]|uniref:glycosyltransferase n=1 Tax=uncultured Thiodictyon sp. TaxID=1846217 RepID=UPI0025E19F6C|nr:glycosyltransferase [uncultured Thiodictyon sp.]
MRVLMISDVYFPRVNGVSTSVQTFAREFVEQGHSVTLIAPDYGRSVPEPFEVLRIPSRALPVDPEDRLLRVRALRRHRADLATRGFDLVHIHTPFVAHYSGVALARRLGVPTVESYHTFFEQYLDKYVPLIPAAWLRFAARRFSAAQCNDVDALVAPSQAMLRVLQRYGVTTPAAVIPTGIKLDQFGRGDGAAFRARHGIPAQRPVLVHVGRLAFEKNVDFLLRVLARVKRQVPAVLLVVAGEGPARRDLQHQAHALGLAQNTLFVGYLERDGALEDCYRAGDAFIFASNTETQGLVLLEALALGVPVVSTAVMGTAEVLVDGCGCLIAPEEEQAFADLVVRVLADPHQRAALSRAGTAYAQAWSAPAMAQRLLAFYATIVARGAPPSGPRHVR